MQEATLEEAVWCHCVDPCGAGVDLGWGLVDSCGNGIDFFLLGSSARSPDRVSTLQMKVRTLEHELHNRNCTIVRTKCSNP